MKTFYVKGESGLSAIHVGESLKNLETYLPDTHCVIITDENIHHLYRKNFPDIPAVTIGTGEKIKTLDTIHYILKKLIALSCDRASFIIGIGGGIVCDIAGFAASIFLRGLDFGFVSTSLLSQVDASVGGKNGVNLADYKNMAGVFNQPQFVICDIDLLKTLPKPEISNGLAEIVKHALIKDAAMFDYIGSNKYKALTLDPTVIFKLVANAVRIKSDLVQKDEKESGERRKLNFGHTIGHAVEKLDPRGHGQAVSIGMAAAAEFSRQKGFLSEQNVDRIVCLLKDLKLPTDCSYPKDEIILATGKDKKKYGKSIFFVFLETIGTARVERISLTQLNQFIESF